MDVDWATICQKLADLDTELNSETYDKDKVDFCQYKLQSAAQPYLQPLEK